MEGTVRHVESLGTDGIIYLNVGIWHRVPRRFFWRVSGPCQRTVDERTKFFADRNGA